MRHTPGISGHGKALNRHEAVEGFFICEHRADRARAAECGPDTRVAVPGTCGELVQGLFCDTPCLVSCPIDAYSVAKLAWGAGTDWIEPQGFPKTAAALSLARAAWHLQGATGRLNIVSSLPSGRGYGSSTADIGAALYALARASGTDAAPFVIAQLATQVEPTDSSLFPGLALFDHLQASLYRDLGAAPPLQVIVIDPGIAVDTISFNDSDYRHLLRPLAPDHRAAFDLLIAGLGHADWAAVGEAASLSSRLHQRILCNDLLDTSFQMAQEVKALGVCRAHSGSILGLLVDDSTVDAAAAVAFVSRRLGDRAAVTLRRLTGGGERILDDVSPRAMSMRAVRAACYGFEGVVVSPLL